MRDYGKVSPQFWTGKTGKALRGKPEVQLLALYLMSSPHANMIGVYHCPVAYMAHETGLPFEGASKALQSLIDADFCTFDEDSEYVFVHQFARHQIGETLKAADKRCTGVKKALAKVPKNQCWQAFMERYAVAYLISVEGEKASHPEAPSKPLASQKQKQKQKQNIPPTPQGGLDGLTKADLGTEPTSESDDDTDEGSGTCKRFEEFWTAWPANERKQDKVKCARKWRREGLDRDADAILTDISVKQQTNKWRDGFIEAPLVYLNGRRWEDGVTPKSDAADAGPPQLAGAI